MAATAIARTKIDPPKTLGAKDSSPTVFRKNAGAVQIWNSISVLQRKAFSALLVNAYEELPDFGVLSHKIPVRVLAHLAGFNSNNTQYLKEALTGLVSTAVQWNIQRADGRDAWTVSATLASARIEDGIVEYAFSNELRRRLYNPEVYAQLDLAIIREFKSGYGLALYENCKLFAAAGETPDFTPKDLRGLLGAGDNAAYENFGRFMDKVIKPATAEVNRISELQVEAVLKRESRRVTSVKFRIQDSSDEAGQIAVNPLQGRDADLAMRIQSEMGVVYGHVLKLFEEHSDEHLCAALEYTKAKYKAGRIQKGKLAGYFVTVVKKAEPGSLVVQQSSLDLPAPAPEPTEQERAASAAAEAERQARKQSLDAAEREWQSSSVERQEALRTAFMAFLAEDNRMIYDSLRRNKSGLESGASYRLLLSWLADRAVAGEGASAHEAASA